MCQLLSKGFYGRQWLFEAVEKWRTASRNGLSGTERPCGSQSRLFWIMGAPGVGKSAFAAQLTHTRGDTVIAAQFCEWDKPDHRNAPRVVRSLAFQLATRLPDYRKLLLTLPEIAELDRKDAAELFDYLLANPLRSVINGGRERYLIVIDALDEAGEAGRNPLVEMLARNAQRLPDWLGLIITSRSEKDVIAQLKGLDGLNPTVLDTETESNRADIRAYLWRELATPLQNRPDAESLVEQILERSEGVFLYVERFCDDVQRGHLSLDRPEQFPQGLGGVFVQYFQRQFPDLEKFRKDVRPALRVILAAREPLHVEILQRLFNWQDEELRDFTRPLASLFPVTTEAGHEVIKPYHKSLADWLVDEAKVGEYFVSEFEGHKALGRFALAEYHRDVFGMSAYSLRYVLLHLRRAQEVEAAELLVRDSKFIEARNRIGLRSFFILHARDCQGLPERMTEDLCSRGHQLASALDSTDTLLFMLSPKASADGYCLDELTMAMGRGKIIQTILVAELDAVRVPVNIGHIQWLDMHDWKERRAAGEAAWEHWYQAKLTEIIRVVGRDQIRQFVGEIKTLEELLKPTASDFAADPRIRNLLEKKLVGRTWLFEAVEKWRTTAERDSRLFWLMGAPGIGKSAFAAHLAHEYGRGTVIAVQFCDWKKPDHRDACRIIRTLAFQIATRLPDYRKLLLTLPILTELDRRNSAELFAGLLTDPLKLSITGGRERYLIVIDALDEAGGDGRNELVEVLARYAGQLPDWIGLVVTSRPEFDVTTPFQALKPFPFETKSAANSDDIRAYLRRELAAQLQNRPDADRLVEQILEKSEGVFLYAERFCEDVQCGRLSLGQFDQFPPSLSEYFWDLCMHQFPNLEKFRHDVRPVIRIILGAQKALSVADIQTVLGWSEQRTNEIIRILGSLFPITVQSGHHLIKPFHPALANWLSDKAKAGPYYVDKTKGERLLSERSPLRRTI